MTNSSPRQQVRRVLIVTLALNIGVAVSKIGIGLMSGALAITADGFHSLMDGSSNVVGLIANRIADQPPDDDHPYGHRRFETMAALVIGALLLLTAWEIIRGILERLQGGEAPVITPLTFGVMLGTLAVNVFVSRYELREGLRLRSELLIADSANTSTDVFVTLSVLISMGLVAVGWGWADIAAALLVVVLIVRAAWQIVRQTGSVLVDTAPYTPERLTALVEELPSVPQVIRSRSRGSADAAYIDIDIQIPPETTADHAAAIETAIREKLNDQLNGVAEIEVHFTPQQNGDRDYALTARAAADALGLTTHEVQVRAGTNGKVLEMHVEVPPGQTLGMAHQRVSQLEHRVQADLSDIAEVITHIEPAQVAAPTEPSDAPLTDITQRIKQQVIALLQAEYPGANWHHLRLYPATNGFVLMMHVTLPPQISIESAHGVAEAAETFLRTKMPELERVTIHTEPPDGGD